MWQWMREQDTLVAVLLTALAVVLLMIIGAWPLLLEWWELMEDQRREHRAVRRAARAAGADRTAGAARKAGAMDGRTVAIVSGAVWVLEIGLCMAVMTASIRELVRIIRKWRRK